MSFYRLAANRTHPYYQIQIKLGGMHLLYTHLLVTRKWYPGVFNLPHGYIGDSVMSVVTTIALNDLAPSLTARKVAALSEHIVSPYLG